MGIPSVRKKESLPGTKPLFFPKGAKHRIFFHNYSLWTSVDGRWCTLKSLEESLEWEALGSDVGELLLGSMYSVIPPPPPHTAAAICPQRCKSLAVAAVWRKAITPLCGVPLAPPCVSNPAAEAAAEGSGQSKEPSETGFTAGPLPNLQGT